MSNSLAIAAVTTTLRNLIAQYIGDELGSGFVTARPPDKARENGDSASQINLFLYQILPSAALRNMDLSKRIKPGETGQPPLALNLYYLITAYGKDNDDISCHRLLGRAMRILHDNAILKPADIQVALADSELHNQVERVRITPVPLSLEDVSKLWTTFQTQYRISAAYEVSVVLIESTLPVKAPLPVLTRGARLESAAGESGRGRGDEGILIQPSLISPFSTLEAVQPPNQQASVRLGEVLTLRGHHLESDDGRVFVRFMHPRLRNAIELEQPIAGSVKELAVPLPNEPADWPAGFYTVAVRMRRNGKEQMTNALPFSLAPRIEEITLNSLPIPGGDESLTLTCSPQVWSGQRVALLLGDRELPPLSDADELDFAEPTEQQKTDTLSFDVTNIPAGEYFVRLRVDGVDSLLVDRSVTPPVFDSSQKVTLP
jgi:hypothetical protein